jgi:FtsH-binding integral membrane protein
VASIVTRRTSFRFFGRARSGYAGTTALITGVMQVVAGGLALAAALAHANQTWDAKLQALLTNPWPLLIPLGVLLIGAGLLLMHRPHRHIGPVGILLYVVPKALAGAVVFASGIAILAGWAWKIYDPNAFLGFVQLYLDGNMHHLERGWHTVIAWLR